MTKLLKKAQDYTKAEKQKARIVTKEIVAVVVAYLKGEVTQRAAVTVLGEKNGWAFAKSIPRYLREGLSNGWITIN